MSAVKPEDVKRGIAVIWENLQCPICLDLMSEPVSTRCDHQFCKFCMNKLLERNKRKETSCPVCKTKVTKRSLQESPGFQKLVEGLQNLVRSYEFDTHTNYFTGLPQRSQGASVETESGGAQGSGEVTTPGGDVTEKEATLSSTAAAKDAFAKLMCLEDSCPEPDRLDATRGETRPADPEDVPARTGAGESQTRQDDGKSSHRRSKRLCLEPDRIVDKRQKKSVQKVSEWLLKISPTSDAQSEGNTEGVLPTRTDSDAERESTASRGSTEIGANAHAKADASPGREAPSRGLQERVFGAVYKRERRSAKIVEVTKSFSPERELEPVACSGNGSERGDEVKVPKRRSSRRLTPADFVRKMSSEDQKEADEESKQGNLSKPIMSSGEQETVEQSGGPDENGSNTEESPAFDVPLKKPGRRSKILEVWQDVDRDFTEKENNTDSKKDRKRRITRSGRDPAKDDDLDKGRNAKYAKCLALVSAGAEVVDLREKLPNNPKLIEAEVNIESYPSSAEPKSPGVRKTRRSSRLQKFTEEVRGHPRRRRSTQALPKPADAPENNPSANLKADGAGASQMNASQREEPERPARGNGCVYNDDCESIEIVQSSEDAAEGPAAEENSLVSVVPDTVDLGEPAASDMVSSTKVTDPRTPLVPESSPQKRRESPSTKTSTPAVEHRDTNQEEDVNDSELDTEQLVKTFKTTKRRSFYLGSPGTSRSRSQDKSFTPILVEDEQKSVDHAEIPGVSQDADPNPCDPASDETTSQTSRSCVADAASVSLLQVKSPAPPSLPEDNQKDNYLETSGSTELPEKVAKSSRSQDSRPPENVQLFSTNVTQEEPKVSRSKDSARSPKSSDIQEEQSQADVDVDSSKTLKIVTNSETPCNNFESSITPDGLVPNGPEALVIEPAATQHVDKMEEGESLSQPCLRRKRKAQRLESSDSESSVENDDLPPLALILNPRRSPRDPEKNPLNRDGVQAEGRSSKPGVDPVSQESRSRTDQEAQSSPSCHSVTPYQKQKSLQDVNSYNGGVPDPASRDEWITSSQGSVDLFGTPQECEDVVDGVCGNTGLSMESSQYSSEIITTQKDEMQQELHRLERMMALVSEAIQKKDGELDDKNKTEDEDQHAGQRGRLRSQRSCNSGKQPSQRSEVKGQSTAPEESTADGTLEKKPNDLRTGRERPLQKGCRAEGGGGMELVVSGLSATEQGLVKKFAKKMKAGVSSQVTASTTHIIIKTDGDLVCERTLKYFQGIAGRKWVLSFQWISECFLHGRLLAEAPYEVCGDVVNGRDHNGPRKARTTPDNSMLMKGCEICFQGSFTDMTTDQMEVMVELCGATVMKDPLMFSRKSTRYQLVVVQPGPDDSQAYYAALQKKATVVTRSWLLDSVATYTLQNPCDYKP